MAGCVDHIIIVVVVVVVVIIIIFVNVVEFHNKGNKTASGPH